MTGTAGDRSAGAPDGYEPISRTEELEDDALLAGAVAAGALRAVEVGAVVFLGLLICPPVAVLLVLVLALFLAALVLGLLAAVVAAPFLLVHHFRGHRGGHLSLLAHRLRGAVRALADLLPHRIVADARNGRSGR